MTAKDDPTAIRCVHCNQIVWLDPTGTGPDEKLLNLRFHRHSLRCPKKPAAA